MWDHPAALTTFRNTDRMNTSNTFERPLRSRHCRPLARRWHLLTHAEVRSTNTLQPGRRAESRSQTHSATRLLGFHPNRFQKDREALREIGETGLICPHGPPCE